MTHENSEPIALIDMDGTLADYDRGMRRDLLRLCSPEERLIVEAAADMHSLELLGDHWKHRMSLIKLRPGWWRELFIMPNQFQIVDMMREMKFDLHILTKGPWKTTSAWTEKVEWCREHVPDASVHITEDKGLVYGKVLMDDYPPYILRWLQWRPRGLVIMPAHPWNSTFSHPNVIRWDGSPAVQDQIEQQLHQVRQTAIGG